MFFESVADSCRPTSVAQSFSSGADGFRATAAAAASTTACRPSALSIPVSIVSNAARQLGSDIIVSQSDDIVLVSAYEMSHCNSGLRANHSTYGGGKLETDSAMTMRGTAVPPHSTVTFPRDERPCIYTTENN